ncbi:hypothetical protein CJ030_MR1G005383 [Morella rubra]|uniref:Uncharacterized protein n=1 Tax=Morella rubra TaxID=262757 RepID=A0A6A1WMX7_9ROSI|nr:hypothetical protein CJ030_MR1G005383 [Morella rubra]
MVFLSETETPAAPEPQRSPMASSVSSPKSQPFQSYDFSNLKWPLNHSASTAVNHNHRFQSRLGESPHGYWLDHREWVARPNSSYSVNEDYHRQLIRKLAETTHSAGPEPRVVSPPKNDNHRVNKLPGLSRKRSEPDSRDDPVFRGVKNGLLSSVGAPERFIEKAAKKPVLTKPLNENPQKKQTNSGPVIEKPEKKSTPSDPKSKFCFRIRNNKKSPAVDDGGAADAPDEDSSVAVEVEEPASKTWNLRPRKPAPRPNANGVGGLPAQETKSQPVRPADSSRTRNGTDTKIPEKRPKLSIALSRNEIEQDIIALTGSKPSRRPKKRVKNIQKQLDNVFPGLWLGSITPEAYRVSDAPGKV